ncbi:MAG: HD domain-containing protein [Bacteroidales bacterium]|jgi:HD superfamily phosphohydrolase|nr:HD domain-containing protein [Bacteroidales bacterium]
MTEVKRKIINDPVYGFINFDNSFHLDLIGHKSFQRLRRIKQLGLTDYVYPGAFHSRFQHALGAGHLMTRALNVLRSKGCDITDEEEEAAISAILLHDIGHGPFSHALEFSVIKGVDHEVMSHLYMNRLNREFNGRLDLAIDIFNGDYHKKYLHQLVSSQLDVDRLDYLRRDSFFSGVSEGAIGLERIISMLTVVDGDIAVELKGIYSVEKFLLARRLMYWQVYLHKTVVAAEELLIQLLRRARYVFTKDKDLFVTPWLRFFFSTDVLNIIETNDLIKIDEIIANFDMIDDADIMTCAKYWTRSDDKILRYLSVALINRNLPKVILSGTKFDTDLVKKIEDKTLKKFEIGRDDLDYLVHSSVISNKAYSPVLDTIKILKKDSSVTELAQVSDLINLAVLSKEDKKYCLCYPRI